MNKKSDKSNTIGPKSIQDKMMWFILYVMELGENQGYPSRLILAEENDERFRFCPKGTALKILTYLKKHNAIETDYEKQLHCNMEENVDLFFEDISGKKTKRPKFEEMYNKIIKRKFDVLLCTELSRLSRNPIDNGRIVAFMDPPKKRKNLT